MTLVVFLRGANVGGYRRLRPSVLANDMRAYDVLSIGSTGTFVVREPGSRANFCSQLLRRLPFEAKLVVCSARELLDLEKKNPFQSAQPHPGMVRFVSVLAKGVRSHPSLPIDIPSDGEWSVRILQATDRFVFGIYRRHMKTIGYLGHIDKLFGSPAITRSWSTMMTIMGLLKTEQRGA